MIILTDSSITLCLECFFLFFLVREKLAWQPSIFLPRFESSVINTLQKMLPLSIAAGSSTRIMDFNMVSGSSVDRGYHCGFQLQPRSWSLMRLPAIAGIINANVVSGDGAELIMEVV